MSENKKDAEVQTVEIASVKMFAFLPLDELEFPQILYRRHSIFALILLLFFLIIAAFSFEGHKASIGICFVAIMWFSAANFEDDNLQRRPHPACWRMLKGVALCYWLILIFLLMHDAQTARDMAHAIFPETGRPLPERDYAADCRLYTPENPVSSFYNFREAFWDAHTLAHLLGWWVKMLILRDWKLCFFLSCFFEWIEITFRYHLKNFWECWWDHLILDIFGCNLFGIILGYYTCKVFEFKKYYITTSPQIFEQLTPFSWVNYRWEIFSSPKKFIGGLYLVAMVNLIDCANFYIRFSMYIPHNHIILFLRVIMWGFLALSINREYYAYFFEGQDFYIQFAQQTGFYVMNRECYYDYRVNFNSEVYLRNVPCNIPRLGYLYLGFNDQCCRNYHHIFIQQRAKQEDHVMNQKYLNLNLTVFVNSFYKSLLSLTHYSTQ